MTDLVKIEGLVNLDVPCFRDELKGDFPSDHQAMAGSNVANGPTVAFTPSHEVNQKHDSGISVQVGRYIEIVVHRCRWYLT